MIYRSPCQLLKNRIFLISLTHIKPSGLNWPNVTPVTVKVLNKDSLISLTELINSIKKASNIRVFHLSSLRLNQIIFLMLPLFIIINDRLTVITVNLINITDLTIINRSSNPTSLRCKLTQASSLLYSPLPGRPTKTPSQISHPSSKTTKTGSVRTTRTEARLPLWEGNTEEEHKAQAVTTGSHGELNSGHTM